MGVRRLSLWMCLLVLPLLLWPAGCAAPATVPATPLLTVTPSSMVTVAPSPPTPSPSPSSSPVPATATATRPLTSTPRPTATLTRTPPPTLPAETRVALVREMLRTNGGCDLPCWWGIVPGKTTVQEFLSNPRTEYGRSSFYVPQLSVPRDYHLYFSFVRQNGVIESIEVVGDFGYGSTMSQLAVQDWQRYSLAQVLTHYSVPSQVWLSFAPAMERGAIPRYGLTLDYDQLGFLIYYEGPAGVWLEGSETKAQACPVFQQMAIIDLRLRPTETYSDTGDLAKEGIYTLRQATGMSLEEFHKTFRDENSGTCLRIPTNGP